MARSGIRVMWVGGGVQMVPRLAEGQEAELAVLQGHLAHMARAGFRTLVIAARDVEPAEYEVTCHLPTPHAPSSWMVVKACTLPRLG